MFFTFFKLYKWYQIAKRITIPKVSKTQTRTRQQMRSNLWLKTPEWRYLSLWCLHCSLWIQPEHPFSFFVEPEHVFSWGGSKFIYFIILLSSFLNPFARILRIFISLMVKKSLSRHSVHWGINPPQKHHPLFLAKPPLNQQTVQAPPPLLGNPPYILAFHDPPKSQIFQWIPKTLKFFILNTILSFKSN